jgi:hypothetical protein
MTIAKMQTKNVLKIQENKTKSEKLSNCLLDTHFRMYCFQNTMLLEYKASSKYSKKFKTFEVTLRSFVHPIVAGPTKSLSIRR